MPNTTQLQSVADALAQIRLAENALDDVIATTAGTESLRALAAIYSQLTSVATSLIRAQTTADDDVFKQVTTSLKVQANALKASEDSIKKIINNVKIAGTVLGYIAQAAEIIITKL